MKLISKTCIEIVGTSMYWPTQKACMDSLVSSNCRAASKATTGSSPANWAVKGEKQECNEVWLYLVISPPVSEANEELGNLKKYSD